jgi:hypothetical protein
VTCRAKALVGRFAQQDGEQFEGVHRAAILQNTAGELHGEQIGLVGDDHGGAAHGLVCQGELGFIGNGLPLGSWYGLAHAGSVAWGS